MTNTKNEPKYWNPVDKKWETYKNSPYFKPTFVSWEEYKKLKTPA